MFPYTDNLTTSGHSYGVTLLVSLLIIVNVPLFWSEALLQQASFYFGFIPLKFSIAPWAHVHTLLTSVFLHADIFHLVGNCLFLVVFGRSLERLFGLPLFWGAFPALGVAGLLSHWALSPDSTAPVIGASGAIAFLMGVYLILFPGARIRMIIFFGWMWKRFTLPSWAFLGYWGGLQLVSILLGSQDGVAYAVHAGCFVTGAFSAVIWKTSYPYAEEKLLDFTKQSFI